MRGRWDRAWDLVAHLAVIGAVGLVLALATIGRADGERSGGTACEGRPGQAGKCRVCRSPFRSAQWGLVEIGLGFGFGAGCG